ncbi:MAG: hypothetical protein R2838_08080 [Caldilineaceae bacterium]
MLHFVRDRFLARQGSFLRPLDAHDIMCAVGGAAVSGGVRRTAMIALFDFDDNEMRQCKNAKNIVGNEQRWNANNSAVWPDRDLSQSEIARYLLEMVESGTGEPGIFSRRAAINTLPDRRQPSDFGTNPCGEIVLRPYQFCNLSIAVARPEDDLAALKEKVELATIIGTIQSMGTYFPGLRPMWQKNCEEERLLGVDINGQMDSDLVRDPDVQRELRDHAVATNKKYAELLGINQSVRDVREAVRAIRRSCSTARRACTRAGRPTTCATCASAPTRPFTRCCAMPACPWTRRTVRPRRMPTRGWHFPVKAPEGPSPATTAALEQCEYCCKSRTTGRSTIPA